MPKPVGLNLAMLLLLDVETRTAGAGQVGYALRDPTQLPRLLDRLFRAMSLLHDTFDVPAAHNEAMTAAALAALGLD